MQGLIKSHTKIIYTGFLASDFVTDLQKSRNGFLGGPTRPALVHPAGVIMEMMFAYINLTRTAPLIKALLGLMVMEIRWAAE